MTLSNVVFADNGATYGGGIFGYESSATLNNVTLSGNRAGLGGAVRSESNSRVVVHNSILWGNVASIHGDAFENDATSDATVSWSVVQGGWAGEGSLDTDPLFVRNPAPGDDGTWGTDDDDFGDLRLLAGSQALNGGNTALLPPDTADLDGDGNVAEPLPFDLIRDPRVLGAAVAMGAYERAVGNQAPVVVADRPALTAFEGQPATMTGTFADPDGDVIALSASIGTLTKDDATSTWTWSWTPDDGPAGPLEVTITATDGEASATTTFQVSVENVAPAVELVGATSEPVCIREQVTFTASIADVPADTHTFSIDWGDGSAQENGAAVGGELSSGHRYATAGVYTVTIRVTDDDGGVGMASFQVTVLTNVQAVTEEVATVRGMGLDTGTTSSLTGKLRSLAALLATSNASQNALQVHIRVYMDALNMSFAKRKLTQAQYDTLMADALLIRDAIML